MINSVLFGSGHAIDTSSTSTPEPLFGFVQIPEAFYVLDHGKVVSSRLRAPAPFAQWTFVFAVVAAAVLFALLLYTSTSNPQSAISTTLIDGWTCSQIIPLSRTPTEVTDADFCGYTNAVQPNILIAPYTYFRGKSETDPMYSTFLNCPSGLQSPRKNQTVYAFRDSYFWNGQQYDTYEQCMNTLTSMCNTHTTKSFQTSITTSPVPFSPYIQFGNIVANAYSSSQTSISITKNWFVFNGTHCDTPCGTTNAIPYAYPASNAWKIAEIGPPQMAWLSVAISSDASILAAVTATGALLLSTDAGSTWSLKLSGLVLQALAMSPNGSKMITGIGFMKAIGKIFVSVDSGATWNAKFIDKSWQAFDISSDGGKMVATSLDGQVYLSNDSGNNWNLMYSSLQYLFSSVVMSHDGMRMAVTGPLFVSESVTQLLISQDGGQTWSVKGPNQFWFAVAMNRDGTKIAAVTNPGQVYVSLDSGESWSAKCVNKQWLSVAVSSDGTVMAASSFVNSPVYVSIDSGNNWNPITQSLQFTWIAINAKADKLVMSVNGGSIFTVSFTDSPSLTYNIPTMSYDDVISIGTSGSMIGATCPAITTPTSISFNDHTYQFCNIPASTLSTLAVNTAWQKAVPEVKKPASSGNWQFGSWGFCLNQSKFQTCDAQFKDEVCNSGFYKAMLGDKLCGKYKQNSPYYCTTDPAYFNAISVAGATAMSALSLIIAVMAAVSGKCYEKLQSSQNSQGKPKHHAYTCASSSSPSPSPSPSSAHAHVELCQCGKIVYSDSRIVREGSRGIGEASSSSMRPSMQKQSASLMMSQPVWFMNDQLDQQNHQQHTDS
jgi:photosystem II stability/assembly factor-like uncharacterized protein